MNQVSRPGPVVDAAPASLADTAYARIRQDIFDYKLIPGDRFSESSMAEKLGMSRTPVRDALSRLQKEGFLELHFRVGWSVRALDFALLNHLYDLRLLLETSAVRRLCASAPEKPAPPEKLDPQHFQALETFWLVPHAERLADESRVAEMDEQFHATLVTAAGNPEMARVHGEIADRIRIIRRLYFTLPSHIDDTYNEHVQILRAIIARRTGQALRLLRSHIEASQAEVKKITLHRLYMARR